MANILPYWMIPRPKRKLELIPQSLRIFAGVATGTSWDGNTPIKKTFEDALDGANFKRSGDYTERAQGRGGSGGRTHGALLYSLGLWFRHQNDPKTPQEVHLTLAGQALVDQKPAFPILRKQVLAFQFPSAYSVRVNVDRKYRLRPFIALLKLLKREELRGYLTTEEVAACVIGYTTGHSDTQIGKTVDRILKFRADGTSSLPNDFTTALRSPISNKQWDAQALISNGGTLGDIADTFIQWLRYIGYGVAVDGEVFDAGRKTVTALNLSMEQEIDQAIDDWGQKPLQTMYEPENDRFALAESAKAFQRTYGVKVGMKKDQRTIRDIQAWTSSERTLAIVSASLNHLYFTQVVTEITDDVVDAVGNHCGLDLKTVRESLETLISSPTHGISAFLDRYEEMSRSGTDKAIAFEKATAEILEHTFGLGARQLGQTGAVPDVEAWSEDWGIIIDTKAYQAYGLPIDHQRAMHADYVPAYAASLQGRPLKAFAYISNGFAKSFDANLRKTVTRAQSHVADVQGSGISMVPWRQVIMAYEKGELTKENLLQLWTMGREVTPKDVQDLIDA
ncbi:AlwI family type II restriction endonuclease [Garicola koreensis]|uniref:Restriction endonuclease n=1 Tax=Garicola koreensis TaxID=1262554 RepID=A0A7W5TRG8_9MICC|nr:AlwI family type II restriction endonuclease [Garicola koreensis]MBB3668520.1 hypothetical protein [Garicola koreensis]